MTPPTIADNLSLIQERVARAAAKASRPVEEITLIGVSKNHSAEAFREGYAAGLRHFGENRVQEWEGKRAQLGDLSHKITSHLIGHLQSNKAARAARSFDRVDSLDEFSLAQRLNRTVAEIQPGKKLTVLLEVHIGGEESKSGVAQDALTQLAERILEFPALELQGLMCIPPFAEDAEEARPHFVLLRTLREKLAGHLGKSLPRLSMGMSHDFEIAIEEGATEIRVGTAIFGSRTIA
jgi:pyridoxal phosphate enzyme (YggS family)